MVTVMCPSRARVRKCNDTTPRARCPNCLATGAGGAARRYCLSSDILIGGLVQMARKQRVEQWADHWRQRDEEERQCRVNGHQRHSQRDRRRWLLVHVRANWSQRERRTRLLSPLVRRVGVVR
jgi:hypothetical protein